MTDKAPFRAEDLVFHHTDLPSPPAILQELNRLAAEPATDSNAFAHVIEQDPSLVARLLRIVNSPFYGLRQKVSSVSLAISLLGLTELRNLITATTVIERFKTFTSPLTSMETFWKHSFRSALLSQQIVRASSIQTEKEGLFISALLHEIGHLLMYQEIPEIMQNVLLGQDHVNQTVWQQEQTALGFDYAEVGALLLEHWFLPEPLYQSIRFHTRPQETETYRQQAALINLCTQFSQLHHLDEISIQGILPPSHPLWEMAGIAEKPWLPDFNELEQRMAESIILS